MPNTTAVKTSTVIINERRFTSRSLRTSIVRASLSAIEMRTGDDCGVNAGRDEEGRFGQLDSPSPLCRKT